MLCYDTCHDSRDSWGDSSVEELECVVSNLLRGGPFLAFSSRSNHARLEEDTLEQDIVLSKVGENLRPHIQGNFKSPVNSVLTIKQYFWLHNWDQPIVLQDQQISLPC